MSTNNIIPDFFKKNDIIKYSKYGRLKYRSEIRADREIGIGIRDKIYRKTKFWCNNISVPGYISDSNTQWQIGGNILHYNWGRIYKPKHKDKLIYFTVGISFDSQSLFYKLDCQKSRPFGRAKLSIEQQNKFRSFIQNKGADWVQVDLDDVSNLNWNKLLRKTNNFIKRFDDLYEDAINIVWGRKIFTLPNNNLLEVDPPEPSTLSDFNSSFIPKKNNYLKMLREGKKIGNKGELLVMDYEREMLKNVLKKGMLIEHISKTKGDGAGYDIKSYDKKGNEIYIEVKTTKSSIKECAFNITPTEILFSKKKNKSYWLYRVFQFDPQKRTGKVYKINGNMEKILDLKPSLYIGVYKGFN